MVAHMSSSFQCSPIALGSNLTFRVSTFFAVTVAAVDAGKVCQVMLDSCIILSKFSRVLCSGLGSPTYQTLSVAGLNLMKPGSFGFWNEASELGFRWLGLGFSTSIRHLLELA